MNSTKIEPKYITKSNPRVGLIALASDFMIERDFINVIKDRDIDFFVNRIECYNPLTKENLIKMSNKVTEVTKDILPDQDIDCVVYGIAIPAFLTIILMPFTYNISVGSGAGFVSYVVIRYLQGRRRDVHPLLLLTAGLFMIYFLNNPINAWVA